MFPILMDHSTIILPRWLLMACVGYIAGAGRWQAGSAALPLLCIARVLASNICDNSQRCRHREYSGSIHSTLVN